MPLKSKMKILVVDGVTNMRMMIRQMLQELKLKNIVEAADGEAAWEAIEQGEIEESPVEFIICDWEIDKLSGLELLRKIRESKYKGIPFLMIIGEAEQGNVVVAVKAGVNNVVVKPFSSQMLVEKISKIFKLG
ncbi:MAG: response regulator [Halobacteriovoraceae bacterium]|jgi:two-component system, chemotaxis family, chemotaxis protein CheY|nr:response regulator [Halobacteriovoraceae bacterium]MBT5095264.1 response regulator [Halobacteriovoraceae bacterium]